MRQQSFQWRGYMRSKTSKLIIVAIALLFLKGSAGAINLDEGFDKGKLPANQVTTDVTNFSKNLSSSDTDVQHALNTLDQMNGGGSQTPWTGNVNGGGFALSNATGNISMWTNDVPYLKADGTIPGATALPQVFTDSCQLVALASLQKLC